MAHHAKHGSSFKGTTIIKQSSLKDTGSTTAWRKLRKRVLMRDAGACQICGLEATHVDHVIPRRLGGDDSMDNLQALCRSCNLSKGGRFFESAKTPPASLGLFTPETARIAHYKDES